MRDIQVTGKEAAAEVGVDPDTIDTWVRRGYLTPIPGTGRPRKYWLSQVFTTEAARRIHPTRRTRQ